MSVSRFAKSSFGDGGGNYRRSASSNTLGSWCVYGSWEGKLCAVVSSDLNVLFFALE